MKTKFLVEGAERLSREQMMGIIGAVRINGIPNPSIIGSLILAKGEEGCAGYMCCSEEDPSKCSDCTPNGDTDTCLDPGTFIAPCNCD